MTKRQIQLAVEKIIAGVRLKGDAALIAYAKRFDKVSLTTRTIKVTDLRRKQALERVNPEIKKALEQCARRIQDFHWEERKRLPQSWTVLKDGVRLGQMINPVDSVGVYVPGGRFSYPSTVLMTAIPARLAGVKRIAMVTPPARLSDEILTAAHIAGVTEIYQVGGPAALAALAIGTKSVPKVDLIVGPGNALVTEAKRQLFGEVGIDLLAGPSELVVLADDTANAAFVAADLMAQAEHDPDSKGFLISLSRNLLLQVKAKISKSMLRQIEFEFAQSKEHAISMANEIAGEHVELMVKRPQEYLDTLKNGGAFFINAWSPAVMGDYWAGPSHVLPTARSARFASGLSVATFIKRSSLIEISGSIYKGASWKSARAIAELEGLSHHKAALEIRSEQES